MPSKSIFKKYKLGPLVAVGAVALVLMNLLVLLIWTLFSLASGTDFSLNTGAPLGIFLVTIFLSCCLMTALIRGGTVFPSALLAALAAIALLLLTPSGLPFWEVLGRVLLIILAAVMGFVITKLCFIAGLLQSSPAKKRTQSSPKKAPRRKTKIPADSDDADADGESIIFSEPGK